MNVEIVFTGLCSILNPRGNNTTMGDPAVIAVQTPGDDEMGDMPDMDHGDDMGHDHHHVAFIGYDSQYVDCDQRGGSKPAPEYPPGRYFDISESVEMFIDGHAPGQPTVLQSYRDVVRKDDYWPAAANRWNREYVPARGDKPTAKAVKAYYRFGSGLLGAGRVSLVEWQFSAVRGHYAEEAFYVFSQSGETLNVLFRRLGDRDDARPIMTFRFSLTKQAQDERRPLTVVIGNNMESDIGNAIERVRTEIVTRQSDHFKYLNRVANGDGPIPRAENPIQPGSSSGGGENGGVCGPGSANG
jgi:hypothetical protein